MKGNSLSRKRNNSRYFVFKKLSYAAIAAVLVSCGSSKPHVITTKAEAQEAQLAIEPKPSSSRRPQPMSRREADTDRVDDELEMEDSVEEIMGSSMIDTAIAHAMEYQGTRYRYGGSSKSGMDCSGLINLSFSKAGEEVPRTSMSLFQATQPIDIKDLQKGDLMFFATGRDRKKINHVALVIEVAPAEIRFIHATVSSGVTVSSFNEPYWLGRYLSSGRLF